MFAVLVLTLVLRGGIVAVVVWSNTISEGADMSTEATQSCDCSDEYGPCEEHGNVLVVREGASLHTADELAMLLIEDLVGVGAELSMWGRSEYTRLSDALEQDRDSVSGTAWFSDPDDADAAASLANQLESYIADLWVIRNDGYTIVRPHDNCPLR